MRRPLTECHPNSSDSSLGRVNGEILPNESIKNQMSAGIIRAPPGFIFACGGWHFPWAYECLDSWQNEGQCLLGYLDAH